MNNIFKNILFLGLALIGFVSCNPYKDDIMPNKKGARTILYPDTYSVEMNHLVRLNVLDNDIIITDGMLLFGHAKHGTIFTDSAGFIYRPKSNYMGLDQFYYKFCSGLSCDSALVTVSVTDSLHNDPCIISFAANNDSLLIPRNTGGITFNVDVLQNDVYCADKSPAVTITSLPRYGMASVIVNDQGKEIINYLKTNPPGLVFSDVLQYQVSVLVNGQLVVRKAYVKFDFQ